MCAFKIVLFVRNAHFQTADDDLYIGVRIFSLCLQYIV